MEQRQSEGRREESQGNVQGRIEAILFVAGEPVLMEELAKALDVSVSEVQTTLGQMRDDYDYHQRGFLIRFVGERVQLATRPLYAPDVVRLLQPIQKQSLSQAAMETLAVVAYKQPITRAEVEQIRGVKCDYSLQSLINKNLVQEVGRKDTVGRPILYGTTPEFLIHFGIGRLDELPAMPQTSGEPAGKNAPAAETIVPEGEIPMASSGAEVE